jgi:hypothetical protein
VRDPLPLSWLARHTRRPVWLSEQILVPAAVTVAGYFAAFSLSFELGLWLILCGISLHFMAG